MRTTRRGEALSNVGNCVDKIIHKPGGAVTVTTSDTNP